MSYGEEGDFYLIFVISSRTKKGFQGALKDYENFIHLYKENNDISQTNH